MDLSNSNMLELIPNFMKNDEAVKSLASSMDRVTQELAPKIKLLSVWNTIDSMNAEQLDALAAELFIPWYEKEAAVDIKRQVIKESDKIHATLGTKYAVERVANIYFGDATVLEWFEYEGNPYCFVIQTYNQKIKNELANSFLKILNVVKRESAHLDRIEVLSDGLIDIHVFIASYDFETTTTYITI